MEDAFNNLINSFIDSDVGIAQNFLSDQLTSHLTANLLSHYSLNNMLSAGTGNGQHITQDKNVRSDVIYWLDRKHRDRHENDFFDVIDRFTGYLNRTCYTGITGYEFHYTLYETGSFYKKHVDQFKNDGNRKYSMVIYLNVGWQQKDGGELCIHHPDHEQNISPSNGKSIFFKSNELEHEVRVTNKPRMSITGWFKVEPNCRVLQ